MEVFILAAQVVRFKVQRFTVVQLFRSGPPCTTDSRIEKTSWTPHSSRNRNRLQYCALWTRQHPVSVSWARSLSQTVFSSSANILSQSIHAPVAKPRYSQNAQSSLLYTHSRIMVGLQTSEPWTVNPWTSYFLFMIAAQGCATMTHNVLLWRTQALRSG